MLPLEGVRVISLSQVYAGPYATRLLADMGAEVIKIESAFRSGRGGRSPQPGVVYPNGEPGERPYNRSAYYNELNRNKYAIALDLSKEKGKEIFKRLVAISDVVVENFSPRVMRNFGLDYPVLKEINPRIIMISLSAYGQTGPYRDYISFGHGIEAMTGLSWLTGYPDSPPLGPGMAYADSTAGLYAAFAVLLALHYRRLSGKGQYIDLSLRETLATLLGEQILDWVMNKKSPQRKGNQDSPVAFQGCYRCRGDDSWIALAISSAQEWASLCEVIGNPALAKTRKFPDLLRQNREELDELIEEWTQKHEPYEAMHILQQAGIRAGVVLDAGGLFQDLHLRERGFWEEVAHPEAGTHPHPGMPWKLSRTPGKIRLPAPCFAQHNEYVFNELLGLPKEEIAELEKEGVIATSPL